MTLPLPVYDQNFRERVSINLNQFLKYMFSGLIRLPLLPFFVFKRQITTSSSGPYNKISAELLILSAKVLADLTSRTCN